MTQRFAEEFGIELFHRRILMGLAELLSLVFGEDSLDPGLADRVIGEAGLTPAARCSRRGMS